MFQVHFDICIGYIGCTVLVHLHLDVWFYISEACKLIEMTPEGIPSLFHRFTSCGDKASSFHQIMPFVKSGCCVVFIRWMNLEFVERINGGDCMLPDVSDNVVEVSSLEHVNWVWRHPELHVDVAKLLISCLMNILRFDASQWVILSFSWKTCIISRLLCPPLTEGSGLKIIDLYWPVPRHIDLLEESPKSVAVSLLPPEEGHLRFDWRDPGLSFLRPPFRMVVTSILYKFQIFSIRYKHLAWLKLRHIKLFLSKLVVNAKSFRLLELIFPESFPRLHNLHLIIGNFLKSLLSWRTLYEALYCFHHFKGKSSHDDSWSFSMHPFMLNTYHDHPELIVPVIHIHWFYLIDGSQHYLSDLQSVFLDFFKRGPFIESLIKIVPIHLINSYSQDLLKTWIDSRVNYTIFIKLIDVDSSSMSIVEDQRMTQRFRSDIVCLFTCHQIKQLLVEVVGLNEIVSYLLL